MGYLGIFVNIELCSRYFLFLSEVGDTAFPGIKAVEERNVGVFRYGQQEDYSQTPSQCQSA